MAGECIDVVGRKRAAATNGSSSLSIGFLFFAFICAQTDLAVTTLSLVL